MQLVLPTASRLDLAMACPASSVLPSEETGSTEAIERGHVCHLFLEEIGSGVAYDDALFRVPDDHRAWISAIDVGRLFAGLTDVECEIPFAVDAGARTVRRLDGSQRDYSGKLDWEFVGTVDVIARRNGRYVIRDYKTGANLGDPADKWQLKFAAAALHLEKNADEIDVEFAYIDPTGQITVDTATFSWWDHDATLEELAKLYNRLMDAHVRVLDNQAPNVRPGSHCRFCPAFWACPSKVGVVRSLVGRDVRRLPSGPELAEMWNVYEQARQVIDRVKPMMAEYVDRTEIILDDDYSVRMVTSSKKELSASKLRALAKSLGATDSQIFDCYTTNTFSYPKPSKRRK